MHNLVSFLTTYWARLRDSSDENYVSTECFHILKLDQQQRDVINSFGNYGKFLGHAESLPQFDKLVKI